MDRIENAFQEGKVYCLSNVQVQKSNADYRIVQNDYQCVLTKDTIVIEEDDRDMPNPSYKLIAFSDVSGYAKQKKFLIDTIGMLIKIDPVIMVNTQSNRTVPKREVFLADKLSATIKLTLWENFATVDGEDLAQRANENIIILATSLLVKDYQGYSLSSTQSTKLILNPNINEAHEITSWLLDNDQKGKALISTVNLETKIETTFENAPKVTIADLIASIDSETSKDGLFRLNATISRIFSYGGLWYISCKKCMKKVDTNEKGLYTCKKCINDNANAILRYFIRVEVMDHTGSYILALFDKTPESLFGCSVTDLKLLKAEENGEKMFAAKLRECTWTKYCFILKISKSHSEHEKKKISVLNVAREDPSKETRELLQSIEQMT